MTRRLIGLAMGAAMAAGCNGGQQGSTAGSSTATTGGSGGAPLEGGAVTTLAGAGGDPGGFADGPAFGDGGARFNRPQGIAVDSKGNLYVADFANNCVRKVDSSGTTTTVANSVGSGGPTGVAVDSSGNLIFAGGRDYHIWKILPAGDLQILAGGIANDSAYVNGAGGGSGLARFKAPAGVAVDAQGNVYVADWDYIRKIDSSLNVTTVAGVESLDGNQKLLDGSGGENGSAQFLQPHGLAVDAAGNIFVADTGNNAIRKIDTSGTVTTIAGTGETGFADGTGGLHGQALFSRPTGVAVDKYGNLFITDSGNNVIRHIDTTGRVSTWAGTGTSSYGDASAPLGASFSNPFGLAVLPDDSLAIADQLNSCIRLIAP